MKTLKALLTAVLVCLAFIHPARAAVIVSTDVLITDDDLPGSVQYVSFSAATAGIYGIQALGFASLGAGYNNGGFPALYLFSDDGSLDAGNLIVGDNSNLQEPFLSVNLGVGDYIIAVSEFSLLLSEALSGINSGNSVQDPNTLIRVIVSNDAAAVSAPATAGLLGLGLMVLGLYGKRQRQRRDEGAA